MEQEIVYLRMRHRVLVQPNQLIRLGQLVRVVAGSDLKQALEELPLHQVKKSDRNYIVFDAMEMIRAIKASFSGLDIQVIGPAQTIVEVKYPKKTLAPVYFCGVWVLLFIGAALAIMNFHEDVSMQAVQQKIYKIVTGHENPKPLIMQIPYSFGLGVGMILFFNHLFRKRLNEEPSPLEVEMFNYQQDLDRYVVFHEKKKGESDSGN
ncbi:MAG TPA: stage V sporulation protein AA [Bacillales bacterium]|nr:stage V sporulation protein AA [Bacillales bacterium]